jgi:hypothetical protein
VNISMARAGRTSDNETSVAAVNQRAFRDHRRGEKVMIGLPADASAGLRGHSSRRRRTPRSCGLFGSIDTATHRFIRTLVATGTTVTTRPGLT